MYCGEHSKAEFDDLGIHCASLFGRPFHDDPSVPTVKTSLVGLYRVFETYCGDAAISSQAFRGAFQRLRGIFAIMELQSLRWSYSAFSDDVTTPPVLDLLTGSSLQSRKIARCIATEATQKVKAEIQK